MSSTTSKAPCAAQTRALLPHHIAIVRSAIAMLVVVAVVGDDGVSPQLSYEVDVALPAYGSHPRSCGFGQLHGYMTGASGSTHDADMLTSLQVSFSKGLQHGETHEGNSTGCFP